MKDRVDEVGADPRAKRPAQAVRNVSDSASSAPYGVGVNYESTLRAAVVEAAPVDPAVSTAGDQPLPASLYRTINLRAWLAILAAGVLGWVLLLKLL